MSEVKSRDDLSLLYSNVGDSLSLLCAVIQETEIF